MKFTDISIDEELESFLPAMTDGELAELRTQIEQDGFTDPIIVWLNHGVIVDGHNRYRIWQEMGRNLENCPEIVEKKFADKAAVMEWMFHRQNGRRNWTAAQKAAVALKMKPAIEERAKVNEKSVGGDKKSKSHAGKSGLMNSSNPIRQVNTRREVAEIAGVSEDTVRKTETVLNEGTPEVKAALVSGEMSANAAFKETRKPSHGINFNPSEWEDGPERTAEQPKPLANVRKAENLLLKITAEFRKVCDGLGPLVVVFDEIKESNPAFAKKHRELLGHHSRLFQVCEDGKRALNALTAAWKRS